MASFFPRRCSSSSSSSRRRCKWRRERIGVCRFLVRRYSPRHRGRLRTMGHRAKNNERGKEEIESAEVGSEETVARREIQTRLCERRFTASLLTPRTVSWQTENWGRRGCVSARAMSRRAIVGQQQSRGRGWIPRLFGNLLQDGSILENFVG